MMIIAAMMSVLAMESCYSYQAVSVDRKFIIERSGADDTATAGKARAGSAAFRLPVKKIFVRMNSLSPVAVINNRAVDLSSQGRFGEAEILFREVLLEDGPDPAVYNNLGIICEAAGNRDEAFRMYTAACRLMPKNDVFRHNFLSFADYRQGKY
jgi:Flp pilus assembly protein TadD, contains TPR repeats